MKKRLLLPRLLLLCATICMVASYPLKAQQLVWSDEFDSSALNRNLWTFDIGNSGFGNGELQTYTDKPENVRVADGNLVIQALRNGNQFTSARLKTQGRFSFQYGRLEARIKLPDVANGLWPAFWLMGNNYGVDGWPRCGEIDVMEVGYKSALEEGTANSSVSGAVHWWHETGTWSSWLQADAHADTTISETFYEDYHIFGMNWYPDRIEIYVDDPEKPYFAIDITAEELSEFRDPAFLLLNLAVGGFNFVDITDPNNITAPFPAQMLVDYVRVYDLGDTEIVTAEETALNGKFGVYTETTAVQDSITLDADAALYIWNNMAATETEAAEGSEALSFDIAANNWYGMGFAATEHDFNMQNYSDGFLKFRMKTTSTETISIGIASSAASEGWINLVSGVQDFGLMRDGAWHEVSIPLNLFANIDFRTIKQVFMMKGNPPAASFNVSVDDIYWEPSGELPAPTGTFAVYSETSEAEEQFTLSEDGELYVWENSLQPATATPFEGEASLSYTSTPGFGWFGMAFTPFVKYDLSDFDKPGAMLHFAIKTTSEVTFSIGMKSGNVNDIGQQWIAFENGNDPYGFVRDGQWHEVNIPMSDFSSVVDLSSVSQLFEVLGTNGAISDLEIDDIYFTGGSSPVIASASQSSTLFDQVAERAVDGNTSGKWWDKSLSMTQREHDPWWQYDQGEVTNISSVEVWNRQDLLGLQLHNFMLYVSEKPFSSTDPKKLKKDPDVFVYRHRGLAGRKTTVKVGQKGRYVMIQLKGKKNLSLAEVVINTTNESLQVARNAYGNTKHDELVPATSSGIYPNPVEAEIHIFVDEEISAKTLTVYSSTGQAVMQIPATHVNGEAIDMSRLKPGIYVLRVDDKSYKFIKK